MKYFILIIALAVAMSGASAQNYQINWYVIGSGGGHSASSSYQIDGTIGQPIVGSSSSSSYRVDAGFWVGTPAGPIGCDYTPGDISGNHAVNGVDIVYAVNYLKGTGPHPPTDCGGLCPEPAPFYAAGDVNGNCAFNGIDVTFFVRYLKLQVPSLLSCPDCPPSALMLPAVMPANPLLINSKPRGRLGK
jgi:hypothetical protein